LRDDRYTNKELIGQSERILYANAKDFALAGREKIDQIRRSGIGTIETRFKLKDGRLIDVLMSSVPLNLEDLSAGITFSVLDITERKRASDALRAAVEVTAGATGDEFFRTLVRCLANALTFATR